MKYLLTAMESRCPACSSESGRLLYEVNASHAAAHFVVERADPRRFAELKAHLRRMWAGDVCRVVQCRQCGLAHADPFVAGDETFYTLAYQRTGYPAWKWEFARTLSEIRRVVDASAQRPVRLLEVGAGEGAFVRRVTPALLPPERVACTEFSSYGVERLKELGVRVLPEDIRQVDPGQLGGPPTIVCMFQVLEHLDRLDDLFAYFNEVCADGASLFLATPNDRRIEFYEAHGGLLDMPPNHVTRWTRRAFEALADRHGWRVEAHEIEPQRFGAFYRRHSIYRYWRSAQRDGTLSNRVAAIASRPLRRALEVMIVAGFAVASTPLIAKMTAPEIGSAQWAHLVKAT